jgi:tRNA pseudouridine38-40 synthase
VLPDDVAVRAIEPADDGFHATRDAVEKTYCFQIHNGRTPNVFARRYAWHYPQPLDAAAMHTAGQALLGRHDFSSFETAGSERPDSIRTVHELAVRRGNEREGEGINASGNPVDCGSSDHITLEIIGDGFLYNMVRTIVGTLVEVGKGGRDVAWPAAVLAARDRRKAGPTAPPQGLFLVRVKYGG